MQYRDFLTIPFIYSLIIPLVLLDVLVTIYQKVSFPIYRIPLVNRKDYFRIDRYKLKNLYFMQKLNCLYCEYANGVLAYAVEIAARTEHYFCPLKHKSQPKNTHRFYDDFIEYNETDRLDQEFNKMKERIRTCDKCDKC